MSDWKRGDWAEVNDYPGGLKRVRVMAVVDNWAMVRRPHCVPFTVEVKRLERVHEGVTA